MECVSCLEDIDDVKYRDGPNSDWQPSPYCINCLNHMLSTQWDRYVNTIKTETCKKTLRNMIKLGPPTNLRDPISLPCNNDNGEVYQIYHNNIIINAKLNGSYEGSEMERYKKELSEYLEEINGD